MMCVKPSRFVEPRLTVKSATASSAAKKGRENDHRCSDIPPDILRALDAEVEMLTTQLKTFCDNSPLTLSGELTPITHRSDGTPDNRSMSSMESHELEILQEKDLSEITGHERHFDIDLEVAEITGAFKPNGFRLGNMAARFKSGYLIDIDDGFDRSLPFRHFRNRYGNASSLVNTPVAKGFFPIKDSKSCRKKCEAVTSPGILKPKAKKILSPLPVSLKDKMAVDKILCDGTHDGTTSSIGHLSALPSHVTQGSDHDSGRSSGQSSEEKTSLDEEPYSICDHKKKPSPKLVRKQTRQKRSSKGARKENLARFFKSFKISSNAQGERSHGRTDSLDSSTTSEFDKETHALIDDVEPGTSESLLPQEITCQTEEERYDKIIALSSRAKRVTFNLTPDIERAEEADYESDGFFSDDDDDSSSWTGSTSSYSSWSSSCSTCCCSCCSCSSCSSCYSDLTVTTIQSDMDDEEIFFLEDDFIAVDEDAPDNQMIRYHPAKVYTSNLNCALNDVIYRNDSLVTKNTSFIPPAVRAVKEQTPTTTRKTVRVSTVYL
ncbi:uncharacterized protein [Ptychodera flava]|uniref:uncharacterized protein n=1 Tax=Ptychodera flava TaxID=63121 RepID=UPI003969F90F